MYSYSYTCLSVNNYTPFLLLADLHMSLHLVIISDMDILISFPWRSRQSFSGMHT